MQITLNQDEIMEALKNYAFTIINVAPGNDINIDLKAGRGENGYSATLDIVPQQLTSDHKPKTPNQQPRSSGFVEPAQGILRGEIEEVQQVETKPQVEASKDPYVELPVAGEQIIDTQPTEEVAEEEDDADVDAVVARQKEQTKSLFARTA
jgi:hypothetical protein